uniref:Uncharacterized protein n=1 Tax=Dikerogammarus haemobaphes virus 1 TaxID=2704946 RepID=A0A6G9HDP3_9VIRU|nr:hypothetical protein [Dikerogammarus haemobaphes virus 1]
MAEGRNLAAIYNPGYMEDEQFLANSRNRRFSRYEMRKILQNCASDVNVDAIIKNPENCVIGGGFVESFLGNIETADDSVDLYFTCPDLRREVMGEEVEPDHQYLQYAMRPEKSYKCMASYKRGNVRGHTMSCGYKDVFGADFIGSCFGHGASRAFFAYDTGLCVWLLKESSVAGKVSALPVPDIPPQAFPNALGGASGKVKPNKLFDLSMSSYLTYGNVKQGEPSTEPTIAYQFNGVEKKGKTLSDISYESYDRGCERVRRGKSRLPSDWSDEEDEREAYPGKTTPPGPSSLYCLDPEKNFPIMDSLEEYYKWLPWAPDPRYSRDSDEELDVFYPPGHKRPKTPPLPIKHQVFPAAAEDFENVRRSLWDPASTQSVAWRPPCSAATAPSSQEWQPLTQNELLLPLQRDMLSQQTFEGSMLPNEPESTYQTHVLESSWQPHTQGNILPSGQDNLLLPPEDNPLLPPDQANLPHSSWRKERF